jgi:hypothetical protein
MFLSLLAVTFIIALLVSFTLARIFSKPLDAILHRIIPEEISSAWLKYLKFAIYVVGISSGVRVWELEKYITPPFSRGPAMEAQEAVLLNSDRWILETYRTVIGTLQGIAWMLLVFFIFSLLAYVAVRIFEARKVRPE